MRATTLKTLKGRQGHKQRSNLKRCVVLGWILLQHVFVYNRVSIDYLLSSFFIRNYTSQFHYFRTNYANRDRYACDLPARDPEH